VIRRIRSTSQSTKQLSSVCLFGVLAASAYGCTQSTASVGTAAAKAGDALSAEICIETNWKAHGNKQDLTCSANDVRVAEATDICVHDGSGGCKTEPTCVIGQDVTFTADFRVVLTAQDRYDVGVYFDTGGDPETDGALTGECVLNTIDGTNAPTTFVNNDTGGDLCGDIDALPAHNPQFMELTITTECVSDGDPDQPRLVLPYCTSWRQPGSNEKCDEAADSYPGAPSKCHCDDDFAIDIFVEDASATLVKTAATEACVTFDVVVTNTTQATPMELATLVDAPYGDITDPTNTNLCGEVKTTCGQAAADGGAGGAGALN
jgi:hypothetical protein